MKDTIRKTTVLEGHAVLGIDEVACEKRESTRETEHRAGKELLRTLLHKERSLMFSDTQWEDAVALGKHGKPYLKDHPDVHFNISHSNGFVACAVADAPVGVDIEWLDRCGEVREALIRRTLTEEEQSAMQAWIEEGYDAREIFFRFWTAKESVLKYLGCGLTRELREIRIELRPPETSAGEWIVSCAQKEVRMEQQKTEDGCIMTICGSSGG